MPIPQILQLLVAHYLQNLLRRVATFAIRQRTCEPSRLSARVHQRLPAAFRRLELMV